MVYQVLRVENRDDIDARLVAHIAGTTRPSTALARPDLKACIPINEDGLEVDLGTVGEMVAGARKQREEVLAERRGKRGRRSFGCVEFVMQGPPFRKMSDRQLKKITSWARDSVLFVSRRMGPESRIAAAALHLDEKEPNVHVLAFVANADRRPGWKRTRMQFAVPADGGPVHADHRRVMSAVQDRYFEEVSSKYGMSRGKVGSTAQHMPIDREKSMVARVEEAREEERERAAADRKQLLAEVQVKIDEAARAGEERGAREAMAKVAGRTRQGDETEQADARAEAVLAACKPRDEKIWELEQELREEREDHRTSASKLKEANRAVRKLRGEVEQLRADGPAGVQETWESDRGPAARAVGAAPPARLTPPSFKTPRAARPDGRRNLPVSRAPGADRPDRRAARPENAPPSASAPPREAPTPAPQRPSMRAPRPPGTGRPQGR